MKCCSLCMNNCGGNLRLCRLLSVSIEGLLLPPGRDTNNLRSFGPKWPLLELCMSVRIISSPPSLLRHFTSGINPKTREFSRHLPARQALGSVPVSLLKVWCSSSAVSSQFGDQQMSREKRWPWGSGSPLLPAPQSAVLGCSFMPLNKCFYFIFYLAFLVFLREEVGLKT